MKIIEQLIYNENKEIAGVLVTVVEYDSQEEAHVTATIKKYKDSDKIYNTLRGIGATSGKEKPIDATDAFDKGILIKDINKNSFIILKPDALKEIITNNI